MGFIYKITNPLNMVYVGQTFDLRKRINSYRYAGNDVWEYNMFNISIINDSFHCFGFESHLFQVLEKNVPLHLLYKKEREWIEKEKSCLYDSLGGMNVLRGSGDIIKYKKDEKKKIYYEGIEEWDYEPFTGAEFLKRKAKLRSQQISMVNKRDGRTFPKWASEKSWAMMRKKVVLYDRGKFVNVFESSISCAEYLKIPRSAVKDSINTGSWARARYKVFNYTENYPMEIPFSNVRSIGGGKKVLVLDKDKKIIKEYDSAEDAANGTFVSATTVRRKCRANDLSVSNKGYIFVYKDLYKSIPSEMEGGVK